MDISDAIRSIVRHEISSVFRFFLFIVFAFFGIRTISNKVNEYFALEDTLKKQTSYALFNLQNQNNYLQERLDEVEHEVEYLFYERDCSSSSSSSCCSSCCSSSDESSVTDKEDEPLEESDNNSNASYSKIDAEKK